MDGFIIDRSDGRDDGEDWTENYEELPGSANISIILKSTTKAGVGPTAAQASVRRNLHHPTRLGQPSPSARLSCRVVPDRSSSFPLTRHTSFSTGPDGYEAVHIHANPLFVTEWLE